MIRDFFHAKKQYLKHATILAIAFILIILISGYSVRSEQLIAVISQFGYIGIFLTGFITGFNLFVPIPAASFFPLFEKAGHDPFVTIVLLSLGMVIADMIGYFLGYIGKKSISVSHPFMKRIVQISTLHPVLLFLCIFAFAAFLPISNELFVIPLAYIGVRFSLVFFAVFFGNIIFNILFTQGTMALSSFFS